MSKAKQLLVHGNNTLSLRQYLAKLRQQDFRHILNQFWTRNEVRVGNLVGTDAQGNEYYENPNYMFGRNRYIYYAKENWVTWNSDVSQIPPEWHRWMHYMTDDPPSLVPLVERKFAMEHIENLSQTRPYTPYSTVKPKIEAWTPPAKPALEQPKLD